MESTGSTGPVLLPIGGRCKEGKADAHAAGVMRQAKPVNERLRHLGGTAKLALDVLQYEEPMERAFTFICGCAPPSWGELTFKYRV